MNNKQTFHNPAVTIKPVFAHDLDVNFDNFVHAPLSLYSTCVRALAKNWQQGTVACQGRSDVSRTNKKPWKQKGTGRARAGSARSPLWKGGGVIFGPQKRVRTLQMPRKASQKVMKTILHNYFENKNILCAQWSVEGDHPKTSHAFKFLRQNSLENKKVVLFVAPYDFHTALSFANISNVRVLSFDQPNAYEVTNSDCWLFLEKDMDHFKEMVGKWL